MGDIKRFKKKYTTPMHPWNATRIKLEKDIRHKYGTGNKKEIWKMESTLKGFKDQVKRLLTRTDEQALHERGLIRERMIRLGLIKTTSGDDEILGLQLKDVMDRRLQTLVLKRKMARSVKHARQLIVHEHITINGTKITSPSYLVLASEESTISYASDSPFMRSDHPEAYDEDLAKKRHEKRSKTKDEREDSIIAFDVVEDPDEGATKSYDASVGDLAVTSDAIPEAKEEPKEEAKKEAQKEESA